MEEIVLVEDFLATVAPAVTAAPTIAEKAVYGLGVAALGMITVFTGLIILIVFITLLGKITSKGGKKKNESKSGEVKKPDEVPAEVMAAITAAVNANETVPADVVAAITAALSVIMGEGKFVVRHVKRISNAPAWNRAGREEQIYSRF